MAEISHLVADPETSSKLKACFPDFSLLKAEIKQVLQSDPKLVQAVLLSPEISDVPQSTWFLFLFNKQSAVSCANADKAIQALSGVSCRGFSFIGDERSLSAYLDELLPLSKEQLLASSALYLGAVEELSVERIFSALSILSLKPLVETRPVFGSSSPTSVKKIEKNFRQFAFVACMLFAFIFIYTSPSAREVLGLLRNQIFAVFFPEEAQIERSRSELVLLNSRARLSKKLKSEKKREGQELLNVLDQSREDRLDRLMSKLESLDEKYSTNPSELKQLEAKIGQALESLADKD